MILRNLIGFIALFLFSYFIIESDLRSSFLLAIGLSLVMIVVDFLGRKKTKL